MTIYYISNTFNYLALQTVPPPIPPPPPPGLPIDHGIVILLVAAILYGCFLIWIKKNKMRTIQSKETNNKKYTIYAGASHKSRSQSFAELIYQNLKKIKNAILFATLFLLIGIQNSSGQIISDQFVYSKSLDIKQTNTWAVGAGFSNFIMHGDLRSIGTGELGNFWNFGGYVYVDKMFNPVLGLELKVNYNNISGGAQYFSDIYDVLYVDGTTINNNLFFEGRAYGAEINMIFSFSNLFIQSSRKWHLAGYFGIGYHQYNSTLYEQNPDGSITELVNFGLNPARQNAKEASSIYLSTQFGIKYRLSKRIDIEFRPSWYFNYEDHLDATISNKQDWETFFVNHIGLTVKLGKKKIYTIWGDEDNNTSNTIPFTIIDTDKDGVMDQLDIEPNTPEGVKVYGNGQAVDADKDGLPDYKDECPLQPGPIENKGCPTMKDSDNDGLFDHEDLCPLQPGPVENKGCPKFKDNSQVTIFKFISDLAANVYFDTGKWILTPDSKNVLDKIAKYMEQVPDIEFKIEGHTDNRDRDSFNLLLSQKRADAVVKYLRKKGIDGKRLSYKGYGETRPKYSNETPQGRQLNRRVEIKPENVLEVDPNEKGNQDSSIHIVTENETLFSIAKKYSLSIEKLKSLNNLKENNVKIGQKIKVKD